MAEAIRDQNHVTAALFESSTTPGLTINGQIIVSTGRIKVDNAGSSSTSLPPPLVATGTVDGSNTSFTFLEKPTYIVSDGAWYRENVGWSWNAGTLTATMFIAPNNDIWGFK